MTPFLNRTDGLTVDVENHAHLLSAEMPEHWRVESPEAVMAEVEFRATHLSSMMEDMFRFALDQNEWEDDET